MRKNETPQDLALYNLQVLFDVESVLEKALPKMIKASSDETLRSGFKTHLDQTIDQCKRLEKIFSILDKKPRKVKAEGIRAIIADSKLPVSLLRDQG